jgi:hypothetical protein
MTNAPFAVLVVSDPQVGNLIRNTVYANINDDLKIWQRLTDGGRGEANAWVTIGEDSIDVQLDSEPVLGSLVALPVSDTDIDFINGEVGKSNNLFQKLLRAWELRKDETCEYTTQEDAHVAITQAWSLGAGFNQFHKDMRSAQTPRIQQPLVKETAVPVLTAPAPTAPEPLVQVPQPVQAMWYPQLSDDRVASYIPRVIEGVREEALYDFARSNQLAVKLEGPAGTGKTSSSTWYSALRGLPMLKLTGSTATDVTDILGATRPDPATGKFIWHDGLLTQACRQPSVILVNEINLLPARMANLLMSAIEERHFTLTGNGNEVVHVHPDTLIVADMNPNYRGTTPLNEALNDRFTISLTFNYSEEIESKIIPSPALLSLAQDMRNDALISKYNAPVSTRMLKTFCQIAKGLSLDFAIETFVNKFPTSEERSSARLLFEASRYNIAQDLGIDDESSSVIHEYAPESN